MRFLRTFRGSGCLLPATVGRALTLAALRLAGIGFVTIGVSATLAFGAGIVFGRAFVAGDPPGTEYTTARCAEFFEYEPHARSCHKAASLHHFGEIVDPAIPTLILGLALLGAHFALRKRWQSAQGVLPDGFVATVGATAFGLAAAALLGQSLNVFVLSTRGVGGFLSEGLSSLVVALAFAMSLYRTLVRRASTDPSPSGTGPVPIGRVGTP